MTVVNQGGVINTGVQVVQTSAPSEIVAVSPLAPNQVLGNDGAGNIAPVTLVAGANITITQTEDQLELAAASSSSASGAVSWITGAGNIAAGGSDVPITQSIASIDSTLPFSSSLITIYGQSSQMLANTTSSAASISIMFSFLSDARLNNSPLTIVFAFYLSLSSTSPAEGALPFYTAPYCLPTTSSATGTFVEYKVPFEIPIPQGQSSLRVIGIPYFYVPSGSTISGTGITYVYPITPPDIQPPDIFVPVSSPSGVLFQDSAAYADAAPITGSFESLMVSQVSLVSVNENLFFPYVGGSADVMTIFEGSMISAGDPAEAVFKMCLPIFIDTTGVTASLITITVSFFSGGNSFFYANLSYEVSGTPFIIDTLDFITELEPAVAFEYIQVGIGYGTDDNSSTVNCGVFAPGTALYQSFLQNYSSATGSVAITDNQKQVFYLSATEPLLLQVGYEFFTPGAPELIDVQGVAETGISYISVTTDYPQSQVEAIFTLCFETDVYTTSPSAGFPILVLSIALGTETIATAAVTIKNSTAGNTVTGTLVCRGRVNLLTSSPFFKANAILLAEDPTVMVVTKFNAIGQGDSTVFSGCVSNWVFNIQSFASSGGSTGSTATEVVGETGTFSWVTTVGNVASVSNQLYGATLGGSGLLYTQSALSDLWLLQNGAGGIVSCALASADNSVTITPNVGSIDLSSPLNISAGSGAFGVVRSNNLNVASISPNVAWNADYIVAGASSGSQKPIFDSTASFVSAYTGSSSQLNLSEYTRFTATAASPPSANNTASPQWIAVLQPLSVTLLQPKVIELIITPALLGALSTQAQAFSKDAYYRYVLGVNMTSTGTPIEFSRMTLLPLESDLYGQTTVPTVADTPPWFTFDVIPAAGNPSGQFTAGNVLVVYAQWILSTVTGITPQFNLAFRTLF